MSHYFPIFLFSPLPKSINIRTVLSNNLQNHCFSVTSLFLLMKQIEFSLHTLKNVLLAYHESTISKDLGNIKWKQGSFTHQVISYQVSNTINY